MGYIRPPVTYDLEQNKHTISVTFPDMNTKHHIRHLPGYEPSNPLPVTDPDSQLTGTALTLITGGPPQAEAHCTQGEPQTNANVSMPRAILRS